LKGERRRPDGRRWPDGECPLKNGVDPDEDDTERTPRRPKASRPRGRRSLTCEALEGRQLLSTATSALASGLPARRSGGGTTAADIVHAHSGNGGATSSIVRARLTSRTRVPPVHSRPMSSTRRSSRTPPPPGDRGAERVPGEVISSIAQAPSARLAEPRFARPARPPNRPALSSPPEDARSLSAGSGRRGGNAGDHDGAAPHRAHPSTRTDDSGSGELSCPLPHLVSSPT
jgi:hypothetical protein